ncbi:MAG: hypothetical protein MUF73_07695 [Rhodobacteraceae bacterium]|jgi:hypothetical protein|nr:hypothetical protein [Paracoccaceae bacterium]
MTQTLRDRLRHDTATDHTAAARALAATGCLDHPAPHAFLAVQARFLLARRAAPETGANGALGSDDPETALARRLQRRIRTALRRDLGVLPAPVVPVAAAEGLQRGMPTAFAYVALGATAGIALLAPRWPDQSHFLDLMGGLGDDWTALAARLAAAPGTGLRAEHVVAAARTIFADIVRACRADAGASRPATGAGAHV